MSDILHIYGQSHWHDDATIAGTREALTALRNAIDTALRGGAAACQSFVNDGEGYNIMIRTLSDKDARRMALPYTDEIASEKGENAFWP